MLSSLLSYYPVSRNWAAFELIWLLLFFNQWCYKINILMFICDKDWCYKINILVFTCDEDNTVVHENTDKSMYLCVCTHIEHSLLKVAFYSIEKET